MKHTNMRAMADALVMSIVYLSTTSADDERADDDCRTLECIATAIDAFSKDEQEAFAEAIGRAIKAEESSPDPNPMILSAYGDMLEDLKERFPRANFS